jgi:hypothetical protein
MMDDVSSWVLGFARFFFDRHLINRLLPITYSYSPAVVVGLLQATLFLQVKSFMVALEFEHLQNGK